MIETCCLKNVVIFIQTILSFVLLRKTENWFADFCLYHQEISYIKIRSRITTMTTTMGAPQKSCSQEFHSSQRKALTLESLSSKVAGWNLKAWTCSLVKNRLLHRHFATYIVKSQEHLSWRTSSNDCLW